MSDKSITLPVRKGKKFSNCRLCKVKLTQENKSVYMGYTKAECRPCLAKVAKKYADKRKKAKKEGNFFDCN